MFMQTSFAQKLAWVRDDRVLNRSGIQSRELPRPDLGDIDGDGYLDLIFWEYEGLQLYRNLGASEIIQFERRYDWEAGIDLESPSFNVVPTLADLDDDDRVELIIPESSMHVWRKSGNSEWAQANSLLAGVQGSRYIAAADLDRDGDLDLVTPNRNNLWVYWNIGTAQKPIWQADSTAIDMNNIMQEPIMAYFDNIRLVDVDADGDADFIATFEIPISYGQVVILENFRSDSLRFRKINLNLTHGRDRLYFVTAGDVDNDGDLDLLTGTYRFLSFWENIGTSRQMKLAEEVLWGVPKNYLEGDATINDLDDDDDPDLLLAGVPQPTDIAPALIQATLYKNIGTRNSFEWKRQEDLAFIEYQRLRPTLQIADFYGTGAHDLVIGAKIVDDYSNLFDYQILGSVIVYYRDSDFSEPDSSVFAQFSKDSIYYDPILFDFNADAKLDLLVQVDGQYQFFENIGTVAQPNWEARPEWLEGLEERRHYRAEPGDVNKDGLPDLVFGEPDGTLKFYENIGTSATPKWRFVSEAFTEVSVDSAAAPALGDLDGDSDLDLVIGDIDGNTTYYRNEIITGVKLGISAGRQNFSLFQNYPNPFNPETTIAYELAQVGHVQFTIYNLLGQRVRTLVDGWMPAGNHSVSWDGRGERGAMGVASGVYVYELKIGENVLRRKMLLLR
jgi:hypothetical protein